VPQRRLPLDDQHGRGRT